MKKIGILTYHYSINEGAMLQAYALQEVCQQLFADARIEMIDYQSFAAQKRDFFKCFEQPLKFDAVWANWQRWRRLRDFKQKYFNLSAERFVGDSYAKSLDFINRQNYDGIIVGSDEVWKIILGKDSVRKFPNVYWLNNKIKAKKFAYAASANKTDYQNLPPETIRLMRDSLESYELVAVRDRFTQKMMRSVLDTSKLDDNKYFKVIDPTLLIGSWQDRPVKEKLVKKGLDLERPTVIFNLENKRTSRTAAAFFRERGWQIISVTAYCPDADINYIDDFDPIEWVSAIAHCQFSVTERFHGTIFSVLGKVPFLAIEKNPRFDYFGTSKLKSLLQDLDLTDNLFVYKGKDFSEAALTEKLTYILEHNDFSHLDPLLAAYRQSGREYLQRVEALC